MNIISCIRRLVTTQVIELKSYFGCTLFKKTYPGPFNNNHIFASYLKIKQTWVTNFCVGFWYIFVNYWNNEKYTFC